MPFKECKYRRNKRCQAPIVLKGFTLSGLRGRVFYFFILYPIFENFGESSAEFAAIIQHLFVS